MRFIIKCNAVFEADNLDDAFSKLSLHFLKLLNQEDSDLFEPDSEINLSEIENATKRRLR